MGPGVEGERGGWGGDVVVVNALLSQMGRAAIGNLVTVGHFSLEELALCLMAMSGLQAQHHGRLI